MNNQDVIDARLEEAFDAGCVCVPLVYISEGLVLRVKLVHEDGCPLWPETVS